MCLAGTVANVADCLLDFREKRLRFFFSRSDCRHFVIIANGLYFRKYIAFEMNNFTIFKINKLTSALVVRCRTILSNRFKDSHCT